MDESFNSSFNCSTDSTHSSHSVSTQHDEFGLSMATGYETDSGSCSAVPETELIANRLKQVPRSSLARKRKVAQNITDGGKKKTGGLK